MMKSFHLKIIYSMKIDIRRSAIRDFKKIPKEQKIKIHQSIQRLEAFPNVPNIKKLTQFEPAYRLRVEDYRILFDVFDDTIVIARVLNRKDSYSK
jgi:mRNA interferase RelE/StbE